MRWLLAMLLLWSFLGCAETVCAGDGSLQELRGDVRRESKKKDKKKKDRDDDDDDHDEQHDDHHRHSHFFVTYNSDDDADAESLLGLLGFAVLTSPFTVPAGVLEEEPDVDRYFPPNPYSDGGGYLTTDTPEEAFTRSWSLRGSADYLDDFHNIERIRGHLLLDTASRFGLETEWNRWQEQLPGDRQDELWTGDFNVVYRFAQSEHAQFRAGLGFNWLSDDSESDFGFNFTYGADFFVGDPWIISTTLDMGRVGTASLFHWRVTLGAVVGPVESFVGYDYTDIGEVQFDGLIAGIRLWF